MQDDPVRKLKVGGGEWDDSLRKIGYLRSKCYGRITRLIPFFRCAERYFQAFNCNSSGVSGGVSSPIKQPFQAELAYAWFVASGTVTAKGMSVNATSEGGLVISYGSGAWGISATAEADTTNVPLNPVSTNDLANWYHATAKLAANYVADDTTRTNVTSSILNGGTFKPNTGEGATNSYVVARNFNIRSTGSSDAGTLAKGLYVSNISVTGATQQMDTALRVGIICSYPGAETGPFIYGPVDLGNSEAQNKAKNNYMVYGAYDESTETVPELGTVALKTYEESDCLLGSDVVIKNSTSTEDYVKVTVLIWFEGEDWNLTSDKYDPSTLSITVDFSSIASNGSLSASGG